MKILFVFAIAMFMIGTVSIAISVLASACKRESLSDKVMGGYIVCAVLGLLPLLIAIMIQVLTDSRL